MLTSARWIRYLICDVLGTRNFAWEVVGTRYLVWDVLGTRNLLKTVIGNIYFKRDVKESTVDTLVWDAVGTRYLLKDDTRTEHWNWMA